MEKAAAAGAGQSEAATAASLEALVAQQEALQKNLETASDEAGGGAARRKSREGSAVGKARDHRTADRSAGAHQAQPAEDSSQSPFGHGADWRVAGLALVMESADKSIRRSSDIFAVVDSKLIVSIPYIVTATRAAPAATTDNVIWVPSPAYC